MIESSKSQWRKKVMMITIFIIFSILNSVDPIISFIQSRQNSELVTVIKQFSGLISAIILHPMIMLMFVLMYAMKLSVGFLGACVCALWAFAWTGWGLYRYGQHWLYKTNWDDTSMFINSNFLAWYIILPANYLACVVGCILCTKTRLESRSKRVYNPF
jgi:ABC-type xylose transport system permease subunit